MRVFFSLLKKDLTVFLSDRVAVGLTFIVPMILITIFGLVFRDSGGPSGIRLLIVQEATGETADAFVEILQQESTFRTYTQRTLESGETVPIDREFAREKLIQDASSWRYALILPEDLVADDFGLNLTLLYNPQNSIENNIVQGILQRAVFSEGIPLLIESEAFAVEEATREAFNSDLAATISKHFEVDLDEVLENINSGNLFGFSSGTDGDETENGEGMSDPFGGLINLEKEQVFGKGKNPAAQSVGGWAVMFLLFSLTGAASSLFEERDKALFQRLLAGPASRTHILWSKFAFSALLGLTQMLLLILFGEVVFNVITSATQIVPLLLISLCASAAATAFGMLLSSVAKTPAQANGLGTLFILSMSALGGAMFPLFMLPEFIREFIAPFTLVYWAMDGILAVLWRDASAFGILQQCGVLLGLSLVFMAIAVVRFRKGDLFR
jgi:ABC-2 type transport system permease protein